MNSIIEMVENKIKPKRQFINEKISKILSLKKKKKKNGVMYRWILSYPISCLTTNFAFN